MLIAKDASNANNANNSYVALSTFRRSTTEDYIKKTAIAKTSTSTPAVRTDGSRKESRHIPLGPPLTPLSLTTDRPVEPAAFCLVG